MSATDEMNDFEKQVASALRRVDAPEGFAARVMESAGAPVAAKVVTMRPRFAVMRQRMWAGGAIAAMLVVGLLVGGEERVRHERERAALANQQFEAAVRVTDQAIEQTRAQLKRAGLTLGE